jgi:hypothetical protein
LHFQPPATALFRSYKPFSAHHARYGGTEHGDIGRANAGAAGADAPRTPEIDVSEDDLRAIAKRDYEGAVTTDLDQQAQAVGLFLTDALLQI